MGSQQVFQNLPVRLAWSEVCSKAVLHKAPFDSPFWGALQRKAPTEPQLTCQTIYLKPMLQNQKGKKPRPFLVRPISTSNLQLPGSRALVVVEKTSRSPRDGPLPYSALILNNISELSSTYQISNVAMGQLCKGTPFLPSDFGRPRSCAQPFQFVFPETSRAPIGVL